MKMEYEIKDDLLEAEKRLALAKSEYFRQQILHKAFQDALMVTKIGNVKSYTQKDETLRAIDKKYSLVESLSYAEVGDSNDHPKSICGVNADEINQAISRIILDDKDIQSHVIPAISLNISKTADNVSLVISNSPEVKMQSLRHEIRERVNVYENTLRQNEETKRMRLELLREYLSALINQFRCLEKILANFSFSSQLDCLNLRSETSIEKLKLLSEEMERLKLILTRNIYSESNLRSLKNIALKLSSKEEDLDVETNDMTSLSNTYLQLGESFANLAREYGKIKSEYEILKWAEEEYSSKT